MKRGYVLFLACALLITVQLPAQTEPGETEIALDLVKGIYSLVSADSGEQVDWEAVRSVFAEEAHIVLRTSRTESTLFTVNSFIKDFQDFYNTPRAMDNGFREKVLRVDHRIYKDIAYVGIVYEAGFPGSDIPGQKGVDFWMLIKRDGEWKVLTVINEIIAPDEPIPDFSGGFLQ